MKIDKTLIPIYNLFDFFKIKKRYKEIRKSFDEMITTPGWSQIQSNYMNDDILYDKENKYIYINTGVQYVPNLSPSFVTMDWVDKWEKFIHKYADNITIETFIPVVPDAKGVATFMIWLHPLVEVENEYYTKRYNAILSNLIFAGVMALLICGIVTYLFM